MNILFKQWIKLIFSLLLLSMTGISRAVPVIAEQILPGNGGFSVAVSGEWGFVGSSQGRGQVFCQVKVYKYDYSTNLWGDGGLGVSETVISGTITPDEPYTQLRNTGSCNTAEFGGFGNSISTSNGLLAVGAVLAKDGGSIRTGKIFFYQYDPAQIANGTGGWVQDAAVGFPVNAGGSSDGQADAGFGSTVSVRYNSLADTAILLVGAPFYDVDLGLPSEKVNAGKAYLYLWNGLTDTVTFINSEEGENAGDAFGTAVTSNATNFLVGAPNYDDGGLTNNGAAYYYSFTSPPATLVSLVQKITASSLGFGSFSDERLGISVSLSPGSDSVMLLGGINEGAVQLKLQASGQYTFAKQLSFTLGGDVSQDGNTAGFGYKGRSVQLYYDKQNITGISDWKFSRLEIGYGRDISISGSHVMVNGNTHNRAYAYYTSSCYNGGTLKANEWTMIGLQCDISSAGAGGTAAASIYDIFSPDLGFSYGDTGEWVMYKQVDNYEGHQPGYVIMASNETMIQGHGYWIITDGDKTWTIPTGIGDFATQTPVEADPEVGKVGRENVAAVQSTNLLTMLGGLVIPTADIRVMFSNPFPTAIDWSLTLFQSLGGAFDLVTIAPFFEDSDNSAYVYKTGVGVHNGYLAIVATTPGMPREIAPGEGFFVRFSDQFYTALTGSPSLLNFLFSQNK